MARRHYRVTLADAFCAHDAALEYGGLKGVNSIHLIESALARPYSGYHRPIARKAAVVLHGMVANHGFVDGNKRTAWLLVEILIDRCGYQLNIRDDEPVDDLVVGIACGDISFDEIVSWFKSRVVSSKDG